MVNGSDFPEHLAEFGNFPEIPGSGRAGGKRRYRTLSAALSEAIGSDRLRSSVRSEGTLQNREHSTRQVIPDA